MKTLGCQISCCSRCRHYTPEGRRGGHCSQLGVPVQGRWQACSLSMPVFMTPLPELGSLEFLPQPIEVHFPEPSVSPQKVPTYAEPPLSHPRKNLAVA